jgi:hypothetical protein
LKKTIWVLLIVTLLLSLLGIIEKIQSEWNNKTYEVVVPYGDIERTVRGEDITAKEALQRLKRAGLQAVSIEPETLESLEDKGYVTSISSEKMDEFSLFDEDLKQIVSENNKHGLYVFIQKPIPFTDQLTTTFFEDAKKIDYKGKDLIFIPGVVSEIESQPLGYMPELIDTIDEAGLSLIIRVPNVEEEENASILNHSINIINNHDNIRVLFLGDEVVGYPDPKAMKEYANKLKENHTPVYTIEFADQKGFYIMAKSLDMNVIRLHSLNMNQISSPEEGIDRAVRAVKERNIRSLFIRMDETPKAEVAIKKTASFIEGIHQNMPKLFHAGDAQVFQPISVPAWSYVSTIIAAALFVSIAVLDIFRNRLLFFASIAFMLLLGAAYLVLDKALLIQGMALLVALITPIYALLPVKVREGYSGILKSYGRAILFSFIGILIMTALLNGNEYLVKVESFRGVKLIYIVPILFVLFYAVMHAIKEILKSPVKYWHTVVLFLVAVVGLYYISRTGNEGAVSAIELTIRQWLEEMMYVRPRTKEFLLGFPVYVLALYVLTQNKKLGTYLLVPSVIGFLSMVNTFTHLHIPFYVSLLRTSYSLILGLILGFVLIAVYKKGYSLAKEKGLMRWFT